MKSPTFLDVAEELIKEAESRVKLGENLPSLTRDYRQRRNAYCRPFFGQTRIDQVDNRKLRDFKIWLVDKGLKSGSINPIMSFVSMVLKFADDGGLIRQAPKVPRAKHRDSPRPAFPRRQYAELLKGLAKIEKGKPAISYRGEAVTWEMRFMVTFLVNSFLRPGDIFKLRHRHVEILKDDNGRAYLRLDYPSSKGHAAPVITMPNAAKIYVRLLSKRPTPPKPDDFVFMPHRKCRAYAQELVRRQFTQVLTHLDLKTNSKGETRTLYSLRHTAITFRLLNAENLDLLTLARNCRTSVEMIDRFYASSLTAEMNLDRLHSFKRPTRHTSAH